MAAAGTRLWSYRDAPLVHLSVGALVCLFVLSPALFTPWGFGPDFTNHIWLIWQQGHAISNTGHPTLYLQQPSGVFEPFYGFYGGTLYAATGALSALLGNHAYPVFIASIGAAAALAYGGMWWLGRQLGLSRWASHLPAFVVVTGAYYLTDAYARGAWPELVALSALPMFLAGGARLLSGPWKPGPVALFALGTVVLTGSHNVTLLFSALIIAPVAIVVWVAMGRDRPEPRRIALTVGLAAFAVGVNAWFLVLDLLHSGDVKAWEQNQDFVGHTFESVFYFNNLGNVLDPFRGTPHESSTVGLAIAAPVAAFALAFVLIGLAWPRVGAVARSVKVLWLVALATVLALIGLLVMPASWWLSLGQPFTDIQFPYRLAGWLLVGIAVLLALSLRLARGLGGWRRRVALVLAGALVVATVVQAAGQMYTGQRLDGHTNFDVHPHTVAFANGTTTAPDTFYDPYSYADASLPQIKTKEPRTIIVPVPEPGATRATWEGTLPPGRAPVPTNIAGGPYVLRVDGISTLGRTHGGARVLRPPRKAANPAHFTLVADGGARQTLSSIVSILCLVGIVALIGFLAVRPRLENRRRPAG